MAWEPTLSLDTPSKPAQEWQPTLSLPKPITPLPGGSTFDTKTSTPQNTMGGVSLPSIKPVLDTLSSGVKQFVTHPIQSLTDTAKRLTAYGINAFQDKPTPASFSEAAKTNVESLKQDVRDFSSQPAGKQAFSLVNNFGPFATGRIEGTTASDLVKNFVNQAKLQLVQRGDTKTLDAFSGLKTDGIQSFDDLSKAVKNLGIHENDTVKNWLQTQKPLFDEYFPKTSLPTKSIEQKVGISENPLLQMSREVSPVHHQVAQEIQQTLKENPVSLPRNIIKPISTQINVKNFNISDASKKVIKDTVEDIKPVLENRVGSKLTNAEVVSFTNQTSKVLQNSVGKEQTKQWESAMLNLRQTIAKSAQNGKVDKDFIENLKILKTQGTDIARKLQSLSIQAEARTPQQEIISAVLKVNDNVDEILKAAHGVDFNDFQQASNFYRKFVSPNTQEWLDLLRYNSMLSSPLTHIVNIFSNLVNSALVAPVEKSLLGGVDLVSSKLTGAERTAFSGEAGAFAKGYVSSLKQAGQRFMDTLGGKRAITNLDTRNIPLATQGIKGKVVSTLSVPMRMLEASDQFFTSLTQVGEEAALKYRAAQGVKVGNIASQAEQKAAYRLYRQDLFPEGQGSVLNAIDHVTSLVMMARNSESKILSTVARFTAPFVKTPMNILKQGIEYSPLGVSTLINSGNKMEQAVKAMIGTGVFTSVGIMVASDRLTWAEPVNEREKNLWRAGGKQPYSIKVGDTWFSYQKLPPPLAFPFAISAALEDAQKNQKIDDTQVDNFFTALAKVAQFTADQSYAKSFGDLIAAIQGGESSIARLISNYPQQLIPFRALTGWLARLFDDVQRKPDPNGTFMEKQLELLMMNYPGLSQYVPARMDEKGNPIPNQNKIMNAFSPVKSTQEVKEFTNFLNNYEKYSTLSRQSSQESAKKKDEARKLYNELKALPKDEANAKVQELEKTNPDMVDQLYNIAGKSGLTVEESYVKTLGVENGLRAQYIYDSLQQLKTPEEKNAHIEDLQNKGIITNNVYTQLKEIISKTPTQNASNLTPKPVSFLDGVLKTKTAQAAENPSYWIRNNEIKDSDLEEAKAVLFGEISNRSSDKQKLEAQTILNTAFNRMDEYAKRGTPKTLTEVLQMDNQYQAFKGKQYTRYKNNELDPTDNQKLSAIDSMLEKVRNGSFQNNIGKSVFYSHKPDGRIIATTENLFK